MVVQGWKLANVWILQCFFLYVSTLNLKFWSTGHFYYITALKLRVKGKGKLKQSTGPFCYVAVLKLTVKEKNNKKVIC